MIVILVFISYLSRNSIAYLIKNLDLNKKCSTKLYMMMMDDPHSLPFYQLRVGGKL